MSYTNLVYHIVFRTHHSLPAIDEQHERDLYAYFHGYIIKHKAKLYRIGGMPDHVHMLVSIPPDIAVSEFVRGLKYATSNWLKHNPLFPLFSGWGEGYAAFTYSKEQIPVVKQYIMNQKEHHHKTSFAEEYRQFILENGGEINEAYFLNITGGACHSLASLVALAGTTGYSECRPPGVLSAWHSRNYPHSESGSLAHAQQPDLLWVTKMAVFQASTTHSGWSLRCDFDAVALDFVRFLELKPG